MKKSDKLEQFQHSFFIELEIKNELEEQIERTCFDGYS